MPGIICPVPGVTGIIKQFPSLNMQPWVIARIKSRWIIIFVVICTAMIWWSRFLWNIIGAYFNEALAISIPVPWSIIPTVVKRNDYIKAALLIITRACAWSLIYTVVKRDAYFKAALLICIDYATLLVVNARYISVVVIPIIMLFFVRALYVVVTPKRDLKSGKENHNVDYNKAGGDDTASKADSNGGAGESDKVLLATAVLPMLVLCCMLHSNAANMVVSQFLLFLTSTIGELALMMARLPSKVAEAFEIIRRSSLVLALVTAHTMAAELLGDDVVLVYMPELITFLIWFSIHFCHGCDGKSRIIEMVTSHRNGILFIISVVIGVSFIYGSEGATDMFCTYMWSVLVYCFCSVILLSLCVFALDHWPAKTTCRLELKGAITLLSFFVNIMSITVAGSLAIFVYVRLRLQPLGLASGSSIS